MAWSVVSFCHLFRNCMLHCNRKYNYLVTLCPVISAIFILTIVSIGCFVGAEQRDS